MSDKEKRELDKIVQSLTGWSGIVKGLSIFVAVILTLVATGFFAEKHLETGFILAGITLGILLSGLLLAKLILGFTWMLAHLTHIRAGLTKT